MTLDGLTLRGAVKELDAQLRNGKIQKILMPTKEEIVLQIYSAQEGTQRLVMSADAGDCGVYLTTHPKENPKTPPAFCMFLRKNLTGAAIESVEQTGLDRVVTFHLRTKDELQRPRKLRLITEIMGKYSNIILVDQDSRVLDSIKRVPADVSRVRQILPGLSYSQPPQHKWDPSSSSRVSLAEAIRPLGTARLDRYIPQVLDGFSTQTAQEVLARAGYTESIRSDMLTPADYDAIAAQIQSLISEAAEHPHPSLQTNADGLPVFFSVVPYTATYSAQNRREFASVNALLDFYYSRRHELQRLSQARTSLARIVSKRLKKTQRIMQICEETLAGEAEMQDLQKRADLITANLYRLQKGMKTFLAEDFETGKEITVPLEVSETPAQTAQRLYRRIAKHKRAAARNAAQLAQAREEAEFLEGSLLYIENAHSLAELAEIRHSLGEAGILAAQKKRTKQTQDTAPAPLRYLSPSGMTVLVGRNDRQNELLTHRTAQRDDLWFHAQKIPGSHVILRTDGMPLEEIDDATIEFAAELAAAHSRAGRSGKTPVDYTQRRNVKKPPKSPPGKVTYDNYYTVYVNAFAGQEKRAEPDGPPLGTI